MFFTKKQKTRGTLSIISCGSGRPFALKVFRYLKQIIREGKTREDVRFILTKETHFSNTEVKAEILESIRGCDAYIIQDVENSVTGFSVDQNLRSLNTMVDAAWRSDAEYITAILPVFPYSRQDKSISREGVSAANVAQEIESYKANRVITLDIHNTAIAGFFRLAKFENLHASKNLIAFIRKNVDCRNLIVIAPDLGGSKRAEYYASQLKTDLGFLYKKRDYSMPNTVAESVLQGDVKGKDVLLIDDMVDTAGTLVSSVRMLKEKEGAKNIYFACSLPLFNHPAVERLNEAYEKGYIKAVIGTDAVYHGEGFCLKNPWYKQVSVAKYFARVIYNINHYRSISELLK